MSICSPSVLHWISNYSLIRSTSCSCSTCSFGFGISSSKNLQDFIKVYSALIKDIFPVAEANPEYVQTDSEQKHKKNKLNMSYRTWPIRSVQVQLSHPVSEPPLRAASGSQEDPEHRRAELNTPRTIPLTMETLAAHAEDSLQRLRRRVKASIARSACRASSSSEPGVGPEEQKDLRRRMDEFMLHEEYHLSTIGVDGELPLDAHGSPPKN